MKGFKKIMFGMFGVLMLVISMSGVSAVKPTTDWGYVQPIVINNANAKVLNNFQVDVALTSANVGANFDWANGNDLRFISAEGDSYSYYIEAWNAGGQTATVKVEVGNLGSSGDTTIYMVYDNSAAVAESNAVDTYILYDLSSHNVGSTPYTWDIEDYTGDWRATWRADGSYGGDTEYMGFYDKGESGTEIQSIRTYKNYHSSSYHDYTYINFYKYLESGVADGIDTSSYDMGRWQDAYDVDNVVTKSGTNYLLTNSEGATINVDKAYGTDQWHDGLSKVIASKYYTYYSYGTIAISNYKILAYAALPVAFQSTGTEIVYVPEDYVPSATPCDYSGSGDWLIDIACTITTNYDIGGNDVTVDSSVVDFQSTVSNIGVFKCINGGTAQTSSGGILG